MERTGWIRVIEEVESMEPKGCLEGKVFKDESQVSGFITGRTVRQISVVLCSPQDSQSK